MPIEERTRFIFASSALAEDTFTLVEFKGFEALSHLYEFEIILDAEDPEIDLKEVLKNTVTLTIELNGEPQRTIHGILSHFEQLHEYSGHIYYRAILVPRLWLADQHHENQLFLDQNVPEIIEEILKQTGLTSQDYELRLTGNYRPWEYICQYNETDFNFISRWMEREGIYYYFDQTDDGEKIIITDSSTAHEDISGDTNIRYSPPDSLIPNTRNQIREFTCRQQMLPKKIILKDYNYRKPSLDLKGEADVDSEGRGNVYIYGEHFKTPEEGNDLATIRAEELLCRETIFHGEGTASAFLSGYIFELYDHYRDSYNQRYLITELHHQGVQANYLTSGSAVAPENVTPSYFNRFVTIPAEVQFRPERLSHKPKFFGTMNAKVDAGGDGQYAEIDNEGRYKISLPFDQNGKKDGKASRWVRMSQPYAGADYGMHFPLHKGTEVLLTFIDGDPDRPVIAGSVPNPETMSPVTGGNQTRSIIRTGGKNEIALEDTAGGQLIKISTPTDGTFFRMGAPNPNGPSGIARGTSGTETINIGGEQYKVIRGRQESEYHADCVKTVRGNTTETFIGNKTSNVQGNTIENHVGNKTSTVNANTTESYVGTKTSTNYAVTDETYVGLKNSLNAALTNEAFVGVKVSNNLAATFENFYGFQMSICAAHRVEKTGSLKLQESTITKIDGKAAVEITCGGSKISMKPGSITIESSLIDIKGGLVRLKGNIQNKDGLKSNKDSFFDKAIHAKNFKSL